jgi:hypothetical protein
MNSTGMAQAMAQQMQELQQLLSALQVHRSVNAQEWNSRDLACGFVPLHALQYCACFCTHAKFAQRRPGCRTMRPPT